MCWFKNIWGGIWGSVSGIWGWGFGEIVGGGVRRECGVDFGVFFEKKYSENSEGMKF